MKQTDCFLILVNGEAASREDIPFLSIEQFRTVLLQKMQGPQVHLVSFFGWEQRLYAAIADDGTGEVLVTSAQAGVEYPALTSECPAFHWFERELFEETGICPKGHPWLKPIRFEGKEPGVTDYFTLGGEGAHEVAVGPVHAGVIEPGHFRFQCLGEDVHTLEISLGYQHRGMTKMLQGGPDGRTIHLMETIAGDSSTAYAGCYAALYRGLTGIPSPSAREEQIQLLAWELERIANHVGDLGALAGDVAFLPTASFCGRIRGDFLNMTAEICGNRFGRGLVTESGCGWKVTPEKAGHFLQKLNTLEPELLQALQLMFEEPTVLDRFEGTGCVNHETAQLIGLVGMAARASGVARDIRASHPYGAYTKMKFAPVVGKTGDVLSRAQIRREELTRSLQLCREVLINLQTSENSVEKVSSENHLHLPNQPLLPNQICLSMAEGWRGEICQVALTDEAGKFAHYHVTDPSFHNWFGLAMALRNEQISNFPICNKSFNLSYCGHDL